MLVYAFVSIFSVMTQKLLRYSVDVGLCIG